MDVKQTAATQNKPAVEEIVDNSGGADETDALIDSVISEVQQEFEAEDLAALPDGEAEPDATAEVDTEAAPDDETPESPAEDAPEEDEDGRSVSRLVAREVELRTKEEALKAREFHAKTIEDENTQLRQHLATMQERIPENVDAILSNPYGVLEAWGFDPEHVIQVALAQKLQKQGKPVPEQLARAIKDAEYDYKFKSIEKEKAQMAQQQKAQAFVQKTEAEARQYIRAMSELKPEFSKDAPEVAKAAKAEPDFVFSEIMDEIGRDAQARAREPGAQLISFAEASRRVEKKWAGLRTRFGSAKQASTPSVDTTAQQTETGASTKASAPSGQVKKAVKPMIPAKPKTQAELEKEGLDAALAEYKRVEMASKKGTAPLRR